MGSNSKPRLEAPETIVRHADTPVACMQSPWPAASDLAARGAALRNFLRSCRARLRPEDCGIAAGKRRRSRGLRQDDVAKLSGVSPRWYEAFERGKLSRRFSTTLVARIADALRLDHHDRAAMFRLALSEVAHIVEHFEQCAQCRP
jgi:DNA-binding XRE family transcriptional regulator